MYSFLLSLALFFIGGSASAEIVLESRRLHLGKEGQWEWDEFKDRKVNAERLEIRFRATANSAEQTLRIRQSNVKLNWPVILNGKKIGALTLAETPMESLFALPPGALVDGENTLLIDPPVVLDDIELGPASIEPQPVKAFLGESRIEVNVTNASDHSALPCRLTLTKKDGTLQPLRAEPEGAISVRTGVVYTRDG